MVLALLLLLALLFTSCAKPIVDGATDASGSESVTEGATQSGETDGASTDKDDSNNESENNGNNNGGENGGENNNGGEEDVPSAGMFDEPINASFYSGNQDGDISWYTGDKSEYILTTADQLIGFNKIRQTGVTFEGITIKLGADMVFNRGTMETVVANGKSNNGWLKVESTNAFLGTFDGQGHTVSGAYLNLGSSANQGLLGSIGKNAEIKNLRVINTLVSGPTAKDKSVLGTLVSRVVGDDANVKITNVTVYSTVAEAGFETTNVGGIVGAISDAGTLTMENCSFYGSVTTTGRSAGGLIGAAINTKATVNIVNCKNYGDITANCDAGGLIGTSAVKTLNVSDSTNKGEIKAPTCKGDLFGYQSNAIDVKNGLRPEGTNLRVMSFNVQSDFDSFSDAGNNRLKAIQQEVYFYDPDIIAVQEDYSGVLAKLSFSGYTRISPSSLSSGMSNCSIFYKSSILTKKTSGSKYITSDGTTDTVALTAADVRTGDYKLTAAELSELGITSSTTDKKMRNLTTTASGTTKLLGPKQITWGVFTVGGKDFICVNVHLHHRSQNAAYSTPAVQKLRLMERLKELYFVENQIKTLKKTYANAEVVILGDFNDLVGPDTYLELKNKFGYSSAHETALERYGVSGSWNNAFKLATQGNNYSSAADRSSNSMLDFIFVSNGFKALKFRVGAGAGPISYQKARYTSDHLPIITDLRFDTVFPTVMPPSVYSGTPDTSWYNESIKSYVLTTADQFVGINQLRKDSEGKITFEGVTIKLGVDVIINEGTWEEIKALNSNDVKKVVATDSNYQFKGTFDGQGHSISGIRMTGAYSYRSIFGGVAGSAVIKNFVLENSYLVAGDVENKKYFGAIIGRINDSKANVVLKDITIADTVVIHQGAYAMDYVGGFVGRLEAGKLTIQNCHFNGTINLPLSQHVAGFVGKAAGGTTIVLNSCHGTGKVMAKDYVAGLAVYTDSTSKTNNGSCLMGSYACTDGKNSNASFIK